MLTLLEKLTRQNAPSGSEHQIHELIRAEIEDFVDEITVDPLGNLLAHKKGDGKRVMFAAHMDEIGILVRYIAQDGFLRFTALGGVSARVALGQRVIFPNGTVGVIGFDDSEKSDDSDLKISDLYLDIGAKSAEEAEKSVKLGDSAAFCGSFSVKDDTVIAKALDDRSGCAVLIAAIREIRSQKNDLWFAFTASEELGLRGAKACSETIKPDFAVAVDVTKTGDVPGKQKMAIQLGDGAAIKIKDSSFLAHPYIKSLMTELCEKNRIPYQYEVLEHGGTDAGAIHLSGGGVPCGCISIPTRYIHTPSEMICQKDLFAAKDLTVQMIEHGFAL